MKRGLLHFKKGMHIQYSKQAQDASYANGRVLCHGFITNVYKTYYKVDTGDKVLLDEAQEFDVSYWEQLVKTRMENAIRAALDRIDTTKFPVKKLESAFVALFGQSHKTLVEDSIRKDLNFLK